MGRRRRKLLRRRPRPRRSLRRRRRRQLLRRRPLRRRVHLPRRRLQTLLPNYLREQIRRYLSLKSRLLQSQLMRRQLLRLPEVDGPTPVEREPRVTATASANRRAAAVPNSKEHLFPGWSLSLPAAVWFS